ncbi:hypothetical protein CRG98_042482 [Punica granatum]|uniref:MATH domain-containing protein n=1 Tax=Punica granatum TaxID=22663 RepID=A0A2I0HZL7_PUNGR|nr:hypothetical protein CRG98_042482 [Punica granatum]
MEEEEQLPSGKYTWMIDSFSEKKNKPKFSSNAFTVGGCKWQITMYLRLEAHYLEISLEFADTAALPDGWCRDANFAFTLTDHDCKITLHVVVPSVELATQVSTLGTYFSSFSDHFTTAGTPYLEEGSSSDRQTIDLASDAPSLDDIEKAKHSVKECLSDLFKLNMRDRLSSALSILSHARAGLSTDQKRSIETFKANFDDFKCQEDACTLCFKVTDRTAPGFAGREGGRKHGSLLLNLGDFGELGCRKSLGRELRQNENGVLPKIEVAERARLKLNAPAKDVLSESLSQYQGCPALIP